MPNACHRVWDYFTLSHRVRYRGRWIIARYTHFHFTYLLTYLLAWEETEAAAVNREDVAAECDSVQLFGCGMY